MNDELDDYFRCEQQHDYWVFEVGVVAWDGPHTPGLVWKPFRRWKTCPTPERLTRARKTAMNTPRFFRTCARCEALHNAGHMHNKQTCQSCAERFFGVVY